MEGPSKRTKSSKTLGLKKSKVGSMENPSDVMVMDSTSQASSNRSKATSTTSNLMQDMKSGSDKGSATLDESLVISILTFPCRSFLPFFPYRQVSGFWDTVSQVKLV